MEQLPGPPVRQLGARSTECLLGNPR